MDVLGLPPVVWPVLAASGGWALAFGFLAAVFRGKWVSENEHVRQLARADAATEAERVRANILQQAVQTHAEASRLANEQAVDMLEGLGTVEQLLRGLMAERDRT